MKKLALLTVAGGLIYSAGCGLNKSDDDWIRELSMNSQFTSKKSADGQPGAAAMGDSMDVWVWWRELTSAPTPDIQISRIGDSAYVEFRGKVGGTLQLWGYNNVSGSFEDYDKPYADSAFIKIIFKKTGSENENGGWVLTDVTGVNGYSEGRTVGVDSIHYWTSSGLDTTITDINAFFNVGSLLNLSAGDTINAEAWTNAVYSNAYFHVIGDAEHQRKEMTRDTLDPSHFTVASMPLPVNPGFHWLVIDVMNNKTLYDKDPASVYDSHIWFAPFNLQ